MNKETVQCDEIPCSSTENVPVFRVVMYSSLPVFHDMLAGAVHSHVHTGGLLFDFSELGEN